MGTTQDYYVLLSPISKSSQVRQTKHAGHCWRSKDELIGDVLQWTHIYGSGSVGRPSRTYINSVWTLDVVWRTYQE